MPASDAPHKGLRHHGLLFVKGMAMGAGDVVPGVSGGTIAFITGIYEELIDSLRSIDQRAVARLFHDGIAAAWRHINGNFLLAVFLGILTSIASLARLITLAMEHHPILVWAFFFGLVCASIVYVARQIKRWRLPQFTGLAGGTLLALIVTLMKPAQLPSDWWMIMVAGSIAICAMILPGISGAFILLLMGLYSTILQAITGLDFFLLGCFALGCVVGLLLFSHLLSWLLHHYHATTLAVLTGFLVGSLNLLWPWKRTLETYVDRHGEVVPLVQENVWPMQYAQWAGQESHWVLAILAAISGVVLVLVLERFGAQNHITEH